MGNIVDPEQDCGAAACGHRLRGDAARNEYKQYLEDICQANPKIFIELSSICNFHCFYCESPNHKRKAQMDDAIFYQVLDQACKMTTNPIQLHCDGEPTVHAKFYEYAKAINDRGLSVILASNGSNLQERYLDLRMDIAVHLSTSHAEFKLRSNLDFGRYLDGMQRYIEAWLRSSSHQNIVYYIYTTSSDRNSHSEMLRLRTCANDFLIAVGLHGGVADGAMPNSTWYARRNPNGYRFRLAARNIASGGMYPDVETKRPVTLSRNFGFCDSPWKRLVILSDGRLQPCCLDLKGTLAFTEPEELESKSLSDLWHVDPRMERIREGFLRGEVTHPTCQKCLDRIPSREFYIPTSHSIDGQSLTPEQLSMWRMEHRGETHRASKEKEDALGRKFRKNVATLSEFEKTALRAQLQAKWDALPAHERQKLEQIIKKKEASADRRTNDI